MAFTIKDFTCPLCDCKIPWAGIISSSISIPLVGAVDGQEESNTEICDVAVDPEFEEENNDIAEVVDFTEEEGL
jgi:hypothetical protein